MQDFDTNTDNTDNTEEQADRGIQMDQVKDMSRSALKRVVALICFGPGVLGFLWLISRILRR